MSLLDDHYQNLILQASCRKRLIEIIKRDALEFGEFTLRSGEKTNFYLDLRKVTLSEGLDIIIQNLHDVLRVKAVGRQFEKPFDAIGGPSIGADPIVSAFLYNQGRVKREMRGFLVRKETKEHGRGDWIIGSVQPGDKVVVVDDVATSGGSLLRACEKIQEYGCEVVQVVAVVDRLAGATKLFREKEIPFDSILTIEDVAERTYQPVIPNETEDT